MNDDPLLHPLIEISWRRKLTEAEMGELEAWLAVHPEARAIWQSEAGLNEALESLGDVPVPTNFTARVVAQVEREQAAAARQRDKGKFFRLTGWQLKWFPRAALPAVALALGLFTYHQHTVSVQRMAQQQAQQQRRREMAQDLAMLANEGANAGAMPTEILTDFRAIQLMSAASASPGADVQLLTLMQ